MDGLTDIVKDLVLHHGVNHHQMLTHIRKVLIDLGKDLPKTQILYNCQHGGFGFSDAFIDFLRAQNVTTCEYSCDARVEYVPFIKPFAEHILAKYRMFRRMVMLCRYYSIDIMASCVREVYVCKNIVAEYEERRETLRRFLQNTLFHGSKDRVGDKALWDILNTKYPTLSDYTKETYEYFISQVSERIDEFTAKQANIKAKYLEQHPQLQWSALYANMEPMIEQMCQEKEKEKEKDNLLFKNKSCLADMLKDGKEQDANIWYNISNKRLSEYAMRYMRVMHQDYEEAMQEEPDDCSVFDYLVSHSVVEVPKEMYDKIVYDIGLMCASSRHCSLAVDKVPQYVEWDIHEYDGLERVIIS